MDEVPEVRAAALRNPALSEEILLAALSGCILPELFEEIYLEARWYFKDARAGGPLRRPLVPAEPMAKKMAGTRDLVQLLERGRRDRRQLHRIVSLFTQTEESENQYLTFWAKRKAPNMLRVIKIFFDRLQRRRTNQASGLSSVQDRGAVGLPGGAGLHGQPGHPAGPDPRRPAGPGLPRSSTSPWRTPASRRASSSPRSPTWTGSAPSAWPRAAPGAPTPPSGRPCSTTSTSARTRP